METQSTKKPARVKVIPIGPNWRKEPGKFCDRAKTYGIRVIDCGGFYGAGSALHTFDGAYESAEDCAVAAMAQLAARLADDIGEAVRSC